MTSITGISDTSGACFGDQRSKYHQTHTQKYPTKRNQGKQQRWQQRNKKTMLNEYIYLHGNK